MHSKKRIVYCMILLCCHKVAADDIGAVPTGVTVNPILTKAMATKRALEFCQEVGEPLNAPSTAIYPAPEQFVGQVVYWQNRWRVVFKDNGIPKATVEVADADNTVVWYKNDAALLQRRNDKSVHQTDISESIAIQKSKAVVTAAGNKDELEFLPKSSLQPSLMDRDWLIEWHRVYAQVPYRLQGANIVLDAQTGSLQSLVKTFISPPPKGVSLKFTPDEAYKIAAQQFAARKLEDIGPTRIQLEVVQPNRLWQPGGKEKETQPVSRVAWTCFRSTKAGPGIDVWVDAETGEVIGGNVDTPPDIEPLEDLHLTDGELQGVVDGIRGPLLSANEIKITPLSEETEQEKFKKTQATPPSLTPEQIPMPLVSLSANDIEAAMLQNFKTKTRFPHRQAQLLTEPDLQFIVPGAYKNEYTYYSKLGILILPGSFMGIVSDEFRDWLNKKIAR